VRIALIGDFSAHAVAHQAIPPALASAAAQARTACEHQWVHTSLLPDDPSTELDAFDGVWCVPGSPYANAQGVLAAIRFARAMARPFLGTCGGFQHALLEYARAAWDVAAPAHAETEPGAPEPVIAPLACSLVEQGGEVYFTPGSRLRAIYGADSAFEEYHCSYGLSPAYAARFASGPLRIAARDASGEVRAVELDGHPFFIGTLYQPERSALRGEAHPLITAFLEAAIQARRALA
jgi:CTP synthase (UTP-ammonia lyase)